MAERTKRPHGWRLSWLQIVLLSLLIAAILVTAIAAGLSTLLVTLLYLGLLAILLMVQLHRMQRS